MPRTYRTAAALAAGVLCLSAASPFIRLAQRAGAPDLAIAAWRLIIAAAVLAPFGIPAARRHCADPGRHGHFKLAWAGFFLALHYGLWITSLSLTSVTASVALVTLYPLMVAAGGWFFQKEWPGLPACAGLGIATAGAMIIGGGDLRAGHHLAGDICAVAGAGAMAGYFLLGRDLRQKLPLMAYVWPVYLVAAVVLTAVAFKTSGLAVPRAAWLWIGLTALVPQVCGHSLLNWALRHVPAALVTLPVLAEPALAALLTWLILAEQPPLAAAIGGVCILFGLALAAMKREVRGPMTEDRRPKSDVRSEP